MINFRVTEEEYNLLRSVSLPQGLSAYARHASLTLAGWTPRGEREEAEAPEFLMACLADLRQRVAHLEAKVGLLVDDCERMQETCA
jgi:hypothetical protein